ncbi:MAG: peptidoglycan DD-metalloendopeptidase family protein [Chloroflexi bacterium]|nr:peptidoglycan DD-metalloendopeptidase family protein [Chloroflexota bacterium]
MPSSWSAYSALKPQTKKRTFWAPLAARLAEPLSDRSAVGRIELHVLLCSLLFLLVQASLSRDWRLPWLSLPGYRPAPVETVIAPPSARPLAQPRYLQRASVPFTVRSLRSVLPLAQPRQREVRSDVFVYTVEPGDTVLGIAQKFGLQGNSLLWANEDLDANPDFLQVGQKLFILPFDGAYHTVVRGETLEEIAKKYKVSVEAIIGYAGNNLAPPYTLQAGQRLVIPAGIKPYVARQVFAYKASAPPQDAQKGSGKFGWPMTGMITQKYWEGHQAIDIANRGRPPVVAADAGYVSYVQSSRTGYGRMVIIDHGNGFETLYAHLDAFYVKVGQSVAKGEVIGKCGSTGNSTGPHLHFEIIKNKVRRNPLLYLP